MLTLLGPSHRYCDGLSRRSFLQAGSLLLGGLTLPDLLRAEQRANVAASHKAVIMVYLTGGLAHQDSFDMKPAAPKEARGEFNPIDTNVPGIQICELMPNLAAMADKYSLIRSIVGLRDEHSSFQTITGYPKGESERNGYPHFGSLVSRVQGNTSPVVPAFVDLFPTMQHRPYNTPGPGNLGPRFAGVKADGEDLASMKLRFVSPTQFDDRRRLLDSVDQFRRTTEGDRLTAADSAYQKAFDVLTSSRLVDALDVTKEDPQLRERYGKGSPNHQGDGGPIWNDQFLQARRLVEAGVRCVTVAYGFWDTHGNNFGHLRGNLPMLDKGISALIQDLHDRGLENDVTVAVWGEFGRTPKINNDAGRDHGPRVNGALLAGGGLRTGQVIGSTDALADSAKDRPVPYQDVLATLYRCLGIDPHELVRDVFDRPVPILPGTAQTIRELV
ncbi:MAG TPA: DUF1501 domain-containing protein [Planctomycetaceae bacterium]|nr:DUF1501 domain-containing protein [Planctomycetaceae bacterium]